MKKLGIIGGMGPEATAELFMRIVKLTQADTDQDHIDMVILNNCDIPDRTKFLLGDPEAEDFTPYLIDMALQLERSGCEVIAMPCNTGHAKLKEIESALSTSHMINMLDKTAERALGVGAAKVGILATDGTNASKVYSCAMAAHGIEAIYPNGSAQADVMAVIYDKVKTGKGANPTDLDRAFDDLLSKGADCVVLGCTELSVIGMPEKYHGLPVIDALTVLAQSSILECGYSLKQLSFIWKSLH